MILISLGGQLLLNFLLLLAVWRGTRQGSIWRKIAVGAVSLEFIWFIAKIVINIIHYKRGEFMRVGASQLADYYIFVSILLLLVGIAYGGIWLLGTIGVIKDRGRLQRLRGVSLLVLLPVSLFVCIKGYYNSKNLVVTEYNISLPYEGEPTDLTIALITDIHFGELIQKDDIKRLVQKVQELHPDYVFVGGDQLDYYFDYVANDPEVTTLMRSLHPDPSKIYHVVGNHEHYIDLDQKINWLQECGVLLRDSVVQLQDHLYLIGRDDAYNTERKPLTELIKNVPSGATTLLLDHQPTNSEEERNAGIHLALHGHTHDGQFAPFKWAVRLRFENAYGFLEKGGTQYITSSGFGYSSSPILIGTLSEVVVIHLKLG